MTARASTRGWPIEFNGTAWIYSDTGKTVSTMRACAFCGKPPTKEGHDACLGTLAGVAFACCGHGLSHKKYIVSED